MKLSNNLYDILKYICTIGLPAIMTFFGVVLPACEVSGETTATVITIMGALATLIGTLIGISSATYKKGEDDEQNN